MSAVGPCAPLVDGTVARYTPWLRATLVVPCCLLGWSSGRTDDIVASIAVIAVSAAWPSLRRRHRSSPGLLIVVDVLLVIAVGFGQVVLGPQSSLSWVFATIGIMSMACHFEWPGRSGSAWLIATSAVVAYGLGHAIAGGGVPLASVVRLIVQSSLSSLSLHSLRCLARSTDRLIDDSARVRLAATVARERRTVHRAHLAMVHDTASTTLLMISTRSVTDLGWVSQQAGRDLALLNAGPIRHEERTDLAAMLHTWLAHQAGTVGGCLPSRLEMPSVVAMALYEGVMEALRNSRLHSGDPRPDIRAYENSGRVVVEVVDRGTGFRPDDIPAHRRGISHSIKLRAAAAGGRAEVLTAPGAGTTVRWTWPEREPPEIRMPPAAAEHIGGRLSARLKWALLAIAGTVQFALSGVGLIQDEKTSESHSAEVAVYVALAAVGLVCALTLIVAGRFPSWLIWLGVAVLLSCSVAVSLAIPIDAVRRSEHWSLGLIGWYGLVLLFEERRRWIMVFLGGHFLLFAAPTLLAVPRPGDLAVLAGIAVTVTGLQVGIGLTGGLARSLAFSADRASRAAEDLLTEETVAEATLNDQRCRYADLQLTTVPLLRCLAAGDADPSDDTIRRRCAIEAARIRRLMCGDDDVNDLLMHELGAVIDIAVRHGVSVSLSVSGTSEEVPAPIRRDLLTPVIDVLMTATSDARVTLLRLSRGVMLSVVCQSPALVQGSAPSSPVRVTSRYGAGRLWLESSWDGTGADYGT